MEYDYYIGSMCQDYNSPEISGQVNTIFNPQSSGGWSIDDVHDMYAYARNRKQISGYDYELEGIFNCSNTGKHTQYQFDWMSKQQISTEAIGQSNNIEDFWASTNALKVKITIAGRPNWYAYPESVTPEKLVKIERLLFLNSTIPSST